MAVRLFSHLHIRNWIAALLDIRNFRRGVLRGAVQHRNRNHSGQTPREPAGEKQIEPHLVAGMFV